MCKWYCTSEGGSTNLQCLHCKARYCGACLHGEGGKMESLVKCAKCGKKPRTLGKEERGTWKGETSAGPASSSSLSAPSFPRSDDDSVRAFAGSLRPDDSGAKTPTTRSPSRSPIPPKSPNGAAVKPKAASKGPSIFDKLTDTSLYTGAHKARFDSNGQGRGLEGRDSIAKGAGSTNAYRGGDVNDLSQITNRSPAVSPRPAAATVANSTSPRPSMGRQKTNDGNSSALKSAGQSSLSAAPKPKAASKGPSIFDKLTDTSLYTGAHKARFDSNGQGRGMAGRDGASGIEYGSAKVTNLSQITRKQFLNQPPHQYS